MNLQLKKQFGQNFLTDRTYAKKLVETADINSEDIVVEIGSGAGMVTQYLSERAAKVIAVEIDTRLVPLLSNRFKDHIDVKKFHLVNEDILKFNVSAHHLTAYNYKVIGSLPYNISKKIIKKFLEENEKPVSCTFLIQKEVAEDYTAVSPKATFLSNYSQLFADVSWHGKVPKEVFNPKPKVDGAIINFVLHDKELEIDKEKFVKFLRKGFSQPRKKLLNNLVKYLETDKENLVAVMDSVGIKDNSRPAELTFKQWIDLFGEVHV